MEIMKIASLGISGVILALLLRQSRSPLAEIVSLTVCLLILSYSLHRISSVFDILNQISSYFVAQKEYFHILLKIIGITYVADFSSNICSDAGYKAIAGQIEIFGKLSILAISTPILLAVLDLIYELL